MREGLIGEEDLFRALLKQETDKRRLGELLIAEGRLKEAQLVKTLRDFCREAAVTLIAEGIETRKQLETLQHLGVSHGQGFLFGLPGADKPLREAYPPLEAVTPK